MEMWGTLSKIVVKWPLVGGGAGLPWFKMYTLSSGVEQAYLGLRCTL